MSNFPELNGSNFEEEVLKTTSGVVLVNFSATWCGPCKRQVPVLESLSKSKTTLKIVKVDIDESPELAQKFGVRSVPTLILFNQGEKVETKIGLTTLSELEKIVSEKTGI